MPPHAPSAPTYPFQSIVCDFFSMAGRTYAAIADRYSNWLSIVELQKDTSQELINVLREYFSIYGIAELFSSDSASIFTSQLFRDFCTRWGIEQRISSAYHPHSNKRAEVAVKSAKRLVRDSLGPGGSLNTDALYRALLAHRNSPDPTSGLSPSQVIFGRKLRDFTPCSPGHYMPREEWRQTAEKRELAMSRRHIRTEEALHTGSKKQAPLIEGDFVTIQDQTGNTPKRWSKTGKVLEALGHDSYLVKVDGSQRLTKRNRQFLRKMEIFQTDTNTPPNPPSAAVSSDTVPQITSPGPSPDITSFTDPVDEDADQANATELDLQDSDTNTSTTGTQRDGPAAYHATPEPSRHADQHLPHMGFPPQPLPPHPAPEQPVLRPQHVSYQKPGGGHLFTPPAPGVPHYDLLRRLEEESRRQALASRELHAYLASIMTNQALSSSVVGGIQSYQLQPVFYQPSYR